MREIENPESQEDYYIDEFGLIVFITSPNSEFEVRIERDLYEQVIRIINGENIFNRVTRHDEL